MLLGNRLGVEYGRAGLVRISMGGKPFFCWLIPHAGVGTKGPRASRMADSG